MKIKKLMTALLATFLVMHGGLQGQVSKKKIHKWKSAFRNSSVR